MSIYALKPRFQQLLRPAVRALQESLLGEGGQVAPHSRPRGAQLVGEFADGGVPAGRQDLHDPVEPDVLVHRR